MRGWKELACFCASAICRLIPLPLRQREGCPFVRLNIILRDTGSCGVNHRKVKLRNAQASLSGFPQPDHSLSLIRFARAAGQINVAEMILSVGVPLLSGGRPQIECRVGVLAGILFSG